MLANLAGVAFLAGRCPELGAINVAIISMTLFLSGFLAGIYSLSNNTLSVMNDAAAFATFTRQIWKDDPILADAVWKKALPPNVIPPWRMGQENQNG